MNFFIFLGAPGSGKGTQAQLLSQIHPTFKHLSTGQVLRDEINSCSEFGQHIQKITESGLLVPDEIILDVIEKQLQSFAQSDSIILDGFPRTLYQANLFEKYIKKTGFHIKKVVYFEIDDDKLIERLSGRYSCANCSAVYHKNHKKPLVNGVCDMCGSTEFIHRKDDSLDVVAERINAYHELTQPLSVYYEELGLINKIDASLSLDLIQEKVATVVLSND